MPTPNQKDANQAIVLGIDTGGTFTDFVLYQQGSVKTHKVLSTPSAPEQAILQGMRDLGIAANTPNLRIVHGTTVATNAALERKGVKTAFVTNRGFKDILSIGRQARKALYDLTPKPTTAPVPAHLCLEVDTRRDAQGRLVTPLTDASIAQLLEDLARLQPDAVAICLLFSFLNDSEEKRLQQAIKRQFGNQIFVSTSAYVLPEYKEYERGIATWYNAYLGPLVQSYLARLSKKTAPAPLAVMQSSGTTIDAHQASQKSVNLMLSGPAGGLAAVAQIGTLLGENKLLSFDMGGTSTDVALVDGRVRLTNEGNIGDLPVAVPMVDMHTIGAGGGSVAYIDNGNMLHVGPESAGAMPGPACYGQAGDQATVTDANAVLGRLPPDNFLGGRMSLDIAAAEKVIGELARRMSVSPEDAAQGVIDLANEHMLQALRLISEQRGQDPSDYRLCGFGGAGGLHICELAESLGMHSAVIPANGGVLSAFGMLVAPVGRELSSARLCLLHEADVQDLQGGFATLENRARDELKAEGHALDRLDLRRTIDCRYKGQSYFLNMQWTNLDQLATDFHKLHEQTYGHCFDLPIELVNIRLSASLPGETLKFNVDNHSVRTPQTCARKIWTRTHNGAMSKERVQMLARDQLPADQLFEGPALVIEDASTTWVAPNWQFKIDQWGNLLLNRLAHKY